ncbi:GH25 family lysozyme [Weissella confusa]|nr:GH25 family lysozyme [Weissella confusa]MED4271984.1 GH25 family lysozyme [Weissella confusa]
MLNMKMQASLLALITAVGVTGLINMSGQNSAIHADDDIPEITAGQGGIPRTDVVDVASYQGNISVDMYQTMKRYGVKGVIVKVSEGTSYVNPSAKVQIENAHAAGLNVGVYHFSRYSNVDDARREASILLIRLCN